jgi:hypothetical protein
VICGHRPSAQKHEEEKKYTNAQINVEEGSRRPQDGWHRHLRLPVTRRGVFFDTVVAVFVVFVVVVVVVVIFYFLFCTSP